MAVYDVSEAFDDQLITVPLHSQDAGEYVNGEWVESRQSTNIKAVIHPMDYSEVLEYDKGAPRDIRAIKIFTEHNIAAGSTLDGKTGDMIEYDGNNWHVIQVADWKATGGYSMAIAYIDKRF